ncbi:hypothetical protein MUO14_00985 [Halobacillus shinanisalinarum]|uniref:GerMN domain-containing protein n=1 Tax=Halobacillus shinanisalinarum TaxID=2932258 RepID=A0ABY4H1U8_9BACI|nr:hypothetical protein [Halobacillus shinanisalinarum]UOQ93617.1 hypothetical protein MUO14_00985 [Halobacillus shinanisalinarum]
MKHNDEQNNRLEKMLHELPEIKDKKTKAEYDRQIPEENSQQRNSRPRWLMPGLASIMALLILAVVVPFSFYTMQDGALETPESTTENQTLTRGNHEGSNSPEKLPAEGSQGDMASTSEQLNSMLVEEITNEMEPLAVADRNAQHIVPLMVMENGKGEEKKTVNADKLGLSESFLKDIDISINKDANKASVIFPNDFTVSGGSAMITKIVDSIKWAVEPYNIDNISLQTEDGAPVSLGSYGEVTSLSSIKEGSFIFKVLKPSSKDTSFFVPISITKGLSISDALKELKKDEENPEVNAPIPSEVKIQSSREEGDKLVVELNDPKHVEKQEMLTGVESILITARHFGYNQVIFENTSVGKLGPYELNGSIETPKGLNPVPADE